MRWNLKNYNSSVPDGLSVAFCSLHYIHQEYVTQLTVIDTESINMNIAEKLLVYKLARKRHRKNGCSVHNMQHSVYVYKIISNNNKQNSMQPKNDRTVSCVLNSCLASIIWH
jgi:hypothetical protein